MKKQAMWLGAAAAAAFAAALTLAPASAAGNGYNGMNSGSPDTMPSSYGTPSNGNMSNSPMQNTTKSEHTKGVSLSSLPNAKQQISNASVEDSSGATIGTVSDVKTTSSGHVRKVQVNLTSSNKTVAIPASDLRFDRNSNTLDARLTRTQIEKLPSI
jgi:hypothetical protein